MNEMNPSLPTATQLPAADVTVPPAEGTSIIHQSYPLKKPEEEANEFIVQVRASILRRTRKKLAGLVSSPFPWHEVLLGLCTLCLGGALGAVASGVPWNDGKAIFFYLILPVVAVGCGVAYGQRRHLTTKSASLASQEILEELPDPDRTK